MSKPTLEDCLAYMESMANNLEVVAPAYRHLPPSAAILDSAVVLRRTVKEWRASPDSVYGTYIGEGDFIKVVTCGKPKEHKPHLWHNGRRFCPAGEYLDDMDVVTP